MRQEADAAGNSSGAQEEESMASTAAKVLAAAVPGSMVVRAYFQLPMLKKAPLEVTDQNA